MYMFHLLADCQEVDEYFRNNSICMELCSALPFSFSDIMVESIAVGTKPKKL